MRNDKRTKINYWYKSHTTTCKRPANGEYQWSHPRGHSTMTRLMTRLNIFNILPREKMFPFQATTRLIAQLRYEPETHQRQTQINDGNIRVWYWLGSRRDNHMSRPRMFSSMKPPGNPNDQSQLKASMDLESIPTKTSFNTFSSSGLCSGQGTLHIVNDKWYDQERRKREPEKKSFR